MADRDLLVRILGDDRDLQRALKNTEKSVQQIDSRTAAFGKTIKTAFGAAGIAIGVRELLQGVDASIEAASDLNEQISKSNVVFGDSAAVIKDWSEETATAIGISQRAAVGAAATFGAIFVNTGQAQDDAAEFSKTLVNLAGDMASFNNATTDESLTALRSGLAGEIEPLRRFNIFLTEATVAQEALALSHKKNAKELTQGEKIQARYNLILRQGAIQSGDYQRTAGNLANQQRTLQANLDDLSTSLGNVLVPALTNTTSAVNELIGAFKELGGLDITPGFNIPSGVTNFLFAPGSALATVAQHLRHPLHDPNEKDAAETIPTDLVLRRNAAEKADKEARALAKKTLAADRQVRAATRAYDAFLTGQGLKLDKAQITTTLDDDLAVLRAMEAAILRRIKTEGRTFKLVEQLTAVRSQIASAVEQQAADAKQAGEDAFNATIDALNLDFEMAQATASLQDDQAALRALEQAILRRIEQEGQTTDLMRQLFNVRQDQAQVAKQLQEQKAQRRKSSQFEALGLDAEGNERTPGIGAIRRRGRNLIKELEASGLDESKVTSFVKRISVIFTKQFDGAGKEIRNAILAMFGEIAGALNQGDKQIGPLTKTTGLSTKKIIEGLGLSAEEANAIRGRLSGFNSAGLALAGAARTSGSNLPQRDRGVPIIVESTTNINLDGQQVASVVTRQQQKARRRNPKQKRGPNRGD